MEKSNMPRLMSLMWVMAAVIWSGSAAFARAPQAAEVAVAAVQRASPAVVSVSVWRMVPSDPPGGPPGRIKAYGSGFIIDPSGIVVTNRHVIDGALDTKVVLDDGTVLAARLVAASGLVDLAVLKVEADRKLPSVEWGDSTTIQVGEPVLTIGNGLNWSSSVSAGIVSALNRSLMDSPFDRYIQTDATVNHGNSGGPLIDLEGKVIGVMTAMYNPSQSGGFIGIGFAIPADTAQ
jgi:serine protease Do